MGDFNKKHHTQGKVVLRGTQKIFMWSCSCGDFKELPFNSAIYLGARIESEKHFNEVMSSDNSDSLDLEEQYETSEVEIENLPPNCFAFGCRNAPLGIVKSYDNQAYCLVHLSALARSGKRNLGITFQKDVPSEQQRKVLKGEWRDASSITRMPKPLVSSGNLDTGSVNEESLEKDVELLKAKLDDLQVRTTIKKSTSTRIKTLLAISLIFMGMFWFSDVQGRRDASEQLKIRNEYAKNCLHIRGEDLAAKSGPVGSVERREATLTFYVKLIRAECIEWGDGTILRNLLYSPQTGSTAARNLENAIRFTLGRANGIEPLTLRCADGWNSPSIGKQGACSSHGGVVSGFLENEEWRLSRFLSSGEWLFPPLYELIEATK
jgi:hypothetical protein